MYVVRSLFTVALVRGERARARAAVPGVAGSCLVSVEWCVTKLCTDGVREEEDDDGGPLTLGPLPVRSMSSV